MPKRVRLVVRQKKGEGGSRGRLKKRRIKRDAVIVSILTYTHVIVASRLYLYGTVFSCDRIGYDMIRHLETSRGYHSHRYVVL